MGIILYNVLYHDNVRKNIIKIVDLSDLNSNKYYL